MRFQKLEKIYPPYNSSPKSHLFEWTEQLRRPNLQLVDDELDRQIHQTFTHEET